MPGGLKKNKNQYISLKEVIEILGCSRDYLTYLCRKGKLKARKIGVEWMTTKKWIEEYQKKNQNTNNIQPRVLSNTTKLRISTNIRIKNKKLKRENGIILPLYFGWALQIKVSLIKYHSYIRKIFVIRKWWQEAVALILLVALVGSGFLFFQNVKNILGATYTWFQTDWSGGADTVNFPVHPTNQTGWTKYYEKDAGITAGTELTLTSNSGSKTQTSDDDFNAGTKDSVYVSGGNVYLQKSNGQTCSAVIECVSGYCADGVCCDTACSGTCQACTAAKKGSGADGTCGNIVNNTDPDAECGGSSCCGYCNGSGACANVASGSTCTTPSDACNATHYRCDGSGSCTAPQTIWGYSASCVWSYDGAYKFTGNSTNCYNRCGKGCESTPGLQGTTLSCGGYAWWSTLGVGGTSLYCYTYQY